MAGFSAGGDVGVASMEQMHSAALRVMLLADFARRRVVDLFQHEGVSFIIHAGDGLPFHSGSPELKMKQEIVLTELRKIAPVTAIRGLGGLQSLPESVSLRIGPATFHIRNEVRTECCRSTEDSGCAVCNHCIQIY